MIPDAFNPVSVTDTCAIWHLVGAKTLFDAALRVNLSFLITPTVYYECFVKRKERAPTPERLALRDLLRDCLAQKRVTQMGVSIEALQETIQQAKRLGLDKRLGQGELSCAALARSLGHAAVLTDNRRDFNAITSLADERLQKTPQLLGWLYVEGHLTDSDVVDVIREHKASKGQMGDVYQTAHRLACEKRLMRQMAAASKAANQASNGTS